MARPIQSSSSHMKAPIQRRKRTRLSGFSLAELMVVIVIIGLLVTVVAPNVINKLGKSQVGIAKASIVEIEKAATQFYLDNNSYPDTLEQLVTKDESGAKYLKQDSIPKDPWGQEYIMETDGDEILIWTYGADKQEGGEGKNRDFNNKMIMNQEI